MGETFLCEFEHIALFEERSKEERNFLAKTWSEFFMSCLMNKNSVLSKLYISSALIVVDSKFIDSIAEWAFGCCHIVAEIEVSAGTMPITRLFYWEHLQFIMSLHNSEMIITI